MKYVAYYFDSDKKVCSNKALKPLIANLVSEMLSQGGTKISILHEKRSDDYYILGGAPTVESYVIRQEVG